MQKLQPQKIHRPVAVFKGSGSSFISTARYQIPGRQAIIHRNSLGKCGGCYLPETSPAR
jgi:hypothetical protein